MKNKVQSLLIFSAIFFLGVLITLFMAPTVKADTLSVSDDTFIDLYDKNANFGTNPGLIITDKVNRKSGEKIVFLKFDTSILPEELVLTMASLKLWIDKVHEPGALGICIVEEPWDEHTLTANSAPSCEDIFVTIPIYEEDEGKFLSIDITGIVEIWLNDPDSNFGIALVPDEIFISIDSKENSQTSHPAEIEIIPEGPPGPQGEQGKLGPEGDQGPQGKIGPQGDFGDQGPQGKPGDQGPQGKIGPQGDFGDQGPQGKPGDQGPQGKIGPQGDFGDQGPQGKPGDQGPQGKIGPQGDFGDQGPQGKPGDQGPQGKIGPQGDFGDQGPQGKLGDQGPQGKDGAPGDLGDQGPQGKEGPQGPQGKEGPDGPPGEFPAAGQQCPPGQFVVGFDPSGNIICDEFFPG